MYLTLVSNLTQEIWCPIIEMLNADDPELDIAKAFQTVTRYYYKTKKTPNSPAEYKLTFTFDDREYSTIFTISKNGFTNKCIGVDYFQYNESTVSSYIGSNSSDLKCFTPVLSKENLPPDVTQTDILQVLISKLKFIYLGTDTISLIDDASIPNPKTGEKFNERFSKWRLLRGEPTLYEKYGYITSDRESDYTENSPHPDLDLDQYRSEISKLTWKDIKDYKIHPRIDETLESIWMKQYKLPSPDQTIPTFMKGLSLEDLENLLIEIPRFETEEEEAIERKELERIGISPEFQHLTHAYTIVGIIINILEKEKGIVFPGLVLMLNKDSKKWASWNRRLVLRSFDLIGIGGGRRRPTHKRRRLDRRCRTYKKIKGTS
jgi:hypothetical protein